MKVNKIQEQVSCPGCGEKFEFSFRDRRGKGERRDHTWQMCPNCNQPVEITVNYTATDYNIKVEKAA